MVEYHKSSAPLSLDPLCLEINVDLTPINLRFRDQNLSAKHSADFSDLEPS